MSKTLNVHTVSAAIALLIVAGLAEFGVITPEAGRTIILVLILMDVNAVRAEVEQ